MEYNEIFRLKKMLEDEGIPFEFMTMFKESRTLSGYRIAYPKDTTKHLVCSVIEHGGSYGHEQDLLEIMGLLTDDEKKGDSVAGWLTAEDVFNRIKEHYTESQYLMSVNVKGGD